jgi:hypothetical protein
MHQVRTLESAMRQLLAEMTLLQYGRTQAFAASSGDTERDPRPAGEACPLAEKWLHEWQRSPCEDTLLMARAELDAWKRSVPRDEDHEWDEDEWILRDGEGFGAEQVARKFNRTPTMIRRLRVKNDRESEFGLSTRFPQAKERVPDAEARVANLAAQGCTLRQIEMQTGVKRETVRRWMKEAA